MHVGLHALPTLWRNVRDTIVTQWRKSIALQKPPAILAGGQLISCGTIIKKCKREEKGKRTETSAVRRSNGKNKGDGRSDTKLKKTVPSGNKRKLAGTTSRKTKFRKTSQCGKQCSLATSRREGTSESKVESSRVSQTNLLTASTPILLSEIRQLQLSLAAEKAVKQIWGENVHDKDKIDSFLAIGSYKELGMLWHSKIYDKKRKTDCPISEYPPSFLDKLAITLPENNGGIVGWRK